jgi:hypothetical protein
MQPNQEDTKLVVEQQEVIKEKTAVEAIGDLRDRYDDGHLAAGQRPTAEEKGQVAGGIKNKLTAALEYLIHQAIHALCPGCIRIGPGKKTGNGIGARSRRQKLSLGSKKRLCEGPSTNSRVWR